MFYFTSFEKKIIIHKKYDRNNQLYDIALLRLEKPIDFSRERHLKTICLAKETDVAKNNYECVATGWGRGNKGKNVHAFSWPLIFPFNSITGRVVTDVLQKLPQPVHNSTTCQQIWKGVGWPITRNHICIGDLRGGKGVCNGDSGGPIQCRLKNGDWVQFGIASWTISDCVSRNFAAVFTSVSGYRNWIIETIRKNSY